MSNKKCIGYSWRDENPDISGVLRAVRVEDNGERLVLEYRNGRVIRYRAEGECCSRSWIEHIDVPNDIDGATVLDVLETDIETIDNHPEHECLKRYETRIRTDRGDVAIEYRNSSNGYYGGMLEFASEDPGRE